ncbi:MAG: chitobiase/beta-hexosaminidase C-terminal domain-containing protein [Ruminiclostridium sp.]|nr:chitobiase/beta-hexosaminidase C-terminal domain-containing protein [Ruminiclostridium sp.]
MGQVKTKKHQVAVYVTDETDLTKIANAEFIRIGKSTTHTVSANPTTNTYDYIDQEQPTTELEKYSYAMEHDIATYKGNADYEWAFEKFFYSDVGDSSKGAVLIVFTDHEQPAGVYKAFIAPATFSVSSANYVEGVVNVSIAFNDAPTAGIVKGKGAPKFVQSPAAPTIVQNENEVTIATTTSGASVKYTDDGKNPALYGEEYSSPITLTETKTIRAVAVKDDATSRVVKQVCEHTP